MGRTLIRWAIALFCLCVIAVFLLWLGERASHAVRHVRRSDEWHDAPVKRYVSPTAEEIQYCLQIVGDIVTAYSNRQEMVMYEDVARLPKSVCDLRGDEYLKVVLPLRRVWSHEWLRFRKDGLREFVSAEDFERTMRVSMALARVYGHFVVDSGLTANYDLVLIECEMLECLQKYKDEFIRENKSNCLRMAEMLLVEWTDQIESENGFARTYVRRQERGSRRFYEKGEATVEELRRDLRKCVYQLQKSCGYTPKWLNTEFPLLHEDVVPEK